MVTFSKRSCYFILLTAGIFLILNPGVNCQYYTSGTDPGSLKWRQIKTPHFRLIYPISFEKRAQYTANGLEYIYMPVSRTIHSPVPVMPVIIHNQTTIPSSVTPYAPRRMDFYTAPPQDLYPQDWVDQLLIHEFRHAAQYSAVNHGFTKVLSFILGEQGTISAIALFVPLWFVEGDATVIETALHYTGRGRTPSFEMKLRAQLVDKGINTFEKATIGSYRDFVPGKYELGYQIVGRAREIYGSDIWNKVLSNVGRKYYTLIPFSSEIKRQTGFNKFGLYDTLILTMQKEWKNLDHNSTWKNYEVLTGNKNKQYISYNLPEVTKTGQIIAVKSGLDDLSKFILIDRNMKEKVLFNAGYNYIQESISVSDSNIYWSEMSNDPRWTMRDYRVIKTYSFKTGKIRQLTHCTRYYAPSVSPDGKLLTAVEVTPENDYNLLILNSRDGSLLRKFNTPDNLLFIHPRWSDDGKQIVSVVFGKNGNGIALTDPENGGTNLLLPFSYMEIKRPSLWNKYVLYTASYNGADNIYALDTGTHEIFQVSSARFGASDAELTNDRRSIIYSNYTSDGYEIVKQLLDPREWTKISVPERSAFPLAEKLTEQEDFIFDRDSVPKVSYKSESYIKAAHLLNFHSWVPLGIDLENISASPGITFLSQNLLGTAVTTGGYLYDQNQRRGKSFITTSVETRYPAFDIHADYGGRQDSLEKNVNEKIHGKWHEFNIGADVRLPLRWTHNTWLRTFQPSVGLSWKFLKMDEKMPVSFNHNNIITANYSLSAANIRKMSLRDIYPEWAQRLEFKYSNTLSVSDKNNIFSTMVTLDFPGLLKHHGIRIYWGIQKKTEDYYTFSDNIIFPRGYQEIFRNKITSLSALYTMPLGYPDWQLGHVLYLKRIKTSVFYDYARSYDNLSPDKFSSEGVDLTLDLTLFNFIAPFDAGLRTVYLNEEGKLKLQFLFAINLNSLY